VFSLDAAAMRDICLLIFAATALACGHAGAQKPAPSASPVELSLSGQFETSLGPTSIDRAIKFVGEQIDAKRTTDAARLQSSPIWDLRIWRYLPADPGHTLNSPVASDDDPFFTPDYLKVSGRQLDYQRKKCEQAGQVLLHESYVQ
jgi:hypothetical protein